MTRVASPWGVVPGGPITAIAVARTGALVCGSLAGLHGPTMDGGAGVVRSTGSGPFVRDVAFIDGDPGHLLVASASGLSRSVDGGQTWQRAALGVQRIVSARTDDLLILLEDGRPCVAHASEHELRVEPILDAPIAVDLALERSTRRLWLADDRSLWSAEPPWRTWSMVDRLDGGDDTLLAVTPDGVLVVGSPGSALRRRDVVGGWTDVVLPIDGPVVAIAAAALGPAIAVATTAGVAWSADAGDSWAWRLVAASLTCLALDDAGGIVAAGTVEGSCLRWDSGGNEMQVVRPEGTALVADMAVSGDRLMVSGFDAVRHSDDGVDWTTWPGIAPTPDGLPLVREPSGAWLGALTASGLRDDAGVVAKLPTSTPVAMAARTTDQGADLAVTDGRQVWRATVEHGDRPDAAAGSDDVDWGEPEPVSEGTRATSLALVGPDGDSPLVALGGQDDRDGSVWLRRSTGWMEVASADGLGVPVRVLAHPADGSLYATIGNALLRPSRAGPLVLGVEYPGGRTGPPISAVVASHQGERLLLAVLTAGGVRWSDDGGLSWSVVREAPEGTPTAIAFDETKPAALFLAMLGGEVMRCPLT